MPAPKPRERVALRHPSGRFTVHVSLARAVELRKRGYTDTAPAASSSEYAKLTVAKLTEEATTRGLEVPAGAKKPDLVALLEADDAENGEED